LNSKIEQQYLDNGTRQHAKYSILEMVINSFKVCKLIIILRNTGIFGINMWKK